MTVMTVMTVMMMMMMMMMMGGFCCDYSCHMVLASSR